ncbi:carbonic anhydrase 1-like isoform X2 [Cephus cinctus]|uniref:Carbonic anhydrase 1-like isoform X2 n=1 Tax=Cephus cinctus TaxID=211228 RepID=A0AAJ7W5L1_CEPCN|nr:carbonic anhydrase 1-like isoform X2 [Cephus cinctus]
MKKAVDVYKKNINKVKFIQQLGEEDAKLESPIDLNMSKMLVMKLNSLKWHNHEVPPKKLKLTNTGQTADGPFLGNYVFSQIHFHWGPTNMKGSEHTVDNGSLPMELHAVHFKSDYLTQEVALRNTDGIAILVYFFKLQSTANPLLDGIIKALPFIQNPRTSTRLIPQSITTILRPFTNDYFVYWGSILTLHSSHSALWLISREPIGISMEQIADFRNINDLNHEPILSNCRPLQDRQNRTVIHVSPSGSRYATLLPIPREPAPLTFTQSESKLETSNNRTVN